MHPNGQIPAYEFAFADVNPPVHAWSVWRVYKRCAETAGERDREWLARCFQKLLLNYNWWINRKDADGNHLFAGGKKGATPALVVAETQDAQMQLPQSMVIAATAAAATGTPGTAAEWAGRVAARPAVNGRTRRCGSAARCCIPTTPR